MASFWVIRNRRLRFWVEGVFFKNPLIDTGLEHYSGGAVMPVIRSICLSLEFFWPTTTA